MGDEVLNSCHFFRPVTAESGKVVEKHPRLKGAFEIEQTKKRGPPRFELSLYQTGAVYAGYSKIVPFSIRINLTRYEKL
jgi:hypothetical protein